LSEGLREKYPNLIHQVRGKGLFNAYVINPEIDNGAKYICLEMLERGILAKPTHEHIIRFAPPLCITKDQLAEGLNRIADSVAAVASHV
jgi:ornithine--oxo-acid transaminase